MPRKGVRVPIQRPYYGGPPALTTFVRKRSDTAVALAAAVGATGVTLLLLFASNLWQPAVLFFLIGSAGAWGMADRSTFRRRWLQLLTQKVSAAAAGVAIFAVLVIVAEWAFALLKL